MFSSSSRKDPASGSAAAAVHSISILLSSTSWQGAFPGWFPMPSTPSNIFRFFWISVTASSCIELRESFLAELEESECYDEAVLALHRAVYKSLDNNIKEFISRGKSFHVRTMLTHDAIFDKIERQNNG